MTEDPEAPQNAVYCDTSHEAAAYPIGLRGAGANVMQGKTKKRPRRLLCSGIRRN